MTASGTPPPITTPGAPPQTRRHQLVTEWPRVRLLAVEIVPGRGTGEPASLVRACVHLGALSPADVQVELIATQADTEDRHTIPRRMWSLFPYHNGAYVFEAQVPLRVLAREEGCAIEVSPSADLVEPGTMEPVIERVPTVP